ncbi:hypothetical protein RF11_09694 [Thelohanellus kitauei]|uniref:HTH CENPB-type domain-containing protein n=1 Tax=Thelohanellus kitauei TaxID=669202 RepID=A0A0C2MT04_THEKT|nr:hypothetical protein RF11_09694 [Thelohanellus kitauei]
MSKKDHFVNLNWIFSLSFPKSVFPFDFLTIPGLADHVGDIKTQRRYHLLVERLYMPEMNFFYGLCRNYKDVELKDGTWVRFVCIDSSPLYYHELTANFMITVSPQDRSVQINRLMELLDYSGICQLPISGSLLMERGKQLAKGLNVKDFDSTNGWLERWKERKNIKFKKLLGAESWIRDSLPAIIKDYEAKDIFNADEIRLY